MDNMTRLFETDGTTYAKAQLAKGDEEQVRCLSFVLGVAAKKISLLDDSKAKFDKLEKCFAMVKDASNTIASSLTLYPAGRDVVVQADSELKRIRSSLERMDGVIAAVEHCESFEAMIGKPWDFDACKPVHGAFVNLGVAVQKFTDVELRAGCGELDRMWQVVLTWSGACLIETWRFLGLLIDGGFSETQANDRQQFLMKVLSTLQGLCAFEGAPEDCKKLKSAFQQASVLFEVMTKGHAIIQKHEKPEPLEKDDCSFLQKNFQSFSLDGAWVDWLVDLTANDAEKERERVLSECETKVKSKFWSAEVRKHVHEISVKHDGLQDAILKLKNAIPVEYQQNKIPAIFDTIDVDDLVNKLSSSGDLLLSRQVSFILAHHRALKCAAELAHARGRALGQSGGDMPVDAPHVQLVSCARKQLTEAATHRCEVNIFAESVPGLEGADMHLKTLDGFMDSTSFGDVAFGACKAELDLWLVRWNDEIEEQVRTIETSIPAGWQSVKDSILDPANQNIVQLMVGNPNFLKMSQAVAKLSDMVGTLKVLLADGCGTFYRDATLKKRTGRAIEEGTETVGMTYALYQLTVAIPKLEVGARKTAIEQTKAAVASKGATLGQSLTDECIRLLG